MKTLIISHAFGLAKSAVCTVRDSAEKLKVLSEELNKVTVVRISYLCNYAIEHVTKTLITCIKDQSQKCIFIYLLF